VVLVAHVGGGEGLEGGGGGETCTSYKSGIHGFLLEEKEEEEVKEEKVEEGAH